MTTIFNLRAATNATFHWTRDFSQIAAAYPVALCVIRMQARISPGAADPPAFQWVTGAGSGGVITFDPATNLCVFAAPESDMAAMTGVTVYDCRLELPGGECVPLFSGRIVWTPGVTRIASDATAQTGVSGIGDTVSVDGEEGTSPVPLPLSLAAALGAALSTWFSALPKSMPASAGQWWNDGGTLAQS